MNCNKCKASCGRADKSHFVCAIQIYQRQTDIRNPCLWLLFVMWSVLLIITFYIFLEHGQRSSSNSYYSPSLVAIAETPCKMLGPFISMAFFNAITTRKRHRIITACAATYPMRKFFIYDKKLKVGLDCSVVDDAKAVSGATRAHTEMGMFQRLKANCAWEVGIYFEFDNQLGDHVFPLDSMENPVKDGAQPHKLLISWRIGISRKASFRSG